MQKVLHVFQLLALAALSFLLIECGLTVRYARSRMVWTWDKVNQNLKESSQTLDEVRKAATTWEQASKDQASKTTKAMSDVSAAAEQFTTFVSRTDASVNGVLVPQLKTSIEQQNAALLGNQKQLQASLQNVAESSTGLQKFLADADVQILNPSIQKSVDSLATTSQNLAVTIEQAAATMKSVRSGVEYEVAQIEKPVTKVKVVFLFILTALGRFFGFA
jgi:hypothetical protein